MAVYRINGVQRRACQNIFMWPLVYEDQNHCALVVPCVCKPVCVCVWGGGGGRGGSERKNE